MNLDSSAFVAERELIEALERRSSIVVCDQNRLLFSQGESPKGLYLLKTGKAILTMQSPTGGVVVNVSASAGSLLGLPALIGNEPYTLTAEAIHGSELAFVTREDFSSLMLSNPALAVSVLRVLAAEVRSARHAISDF
jgi:CRP-like cAMP-binding protein